MGDSVISVRVGSDSKATMHWRHGDAVLSFGGAVARVEVIIPDHMFTALVREHVGALVSELSIDDIVMSERLRNLLRERGISTIDEARRIPGRVIREGGGFGQKSLSELHSLADKFGIEWRLPSFPDKDLAG